MNMGTRPRDDTFPFICNRYAGEIMGGGDLGHWERRPAGGLSDISYSGEAENCDGYVGSGMQEQQEDSQA